ncbi:cytochrome P450 [Micromonospora orduensis]|uniref:Cytochrome P450 n=1 Tax=Micromonospora orduensis TaxID=1420891 RepID=A0A5C4QEY5_9ACTN|nr:cytochrome P450 [Micromonospora orduensis]TNH22699.1 cytochrome P450 [Micromonospora orduensis]
MELAGTIDLDQVNLFDPAFFATRDPHPVWAEMRRHAPLHRQTLPDGRAFRSVTRYADACRVLGQSEEFTSLRGNLLNQLGRDDPAAGQMLVATDPPWHGHLRRPLAGLFAGRAVARTEDLVRRAVGELLAAAEPGTQWDLAHEAALLPMAVAGHLMDISAEHWSRLVGLTSMAAAPDDPAFRTVNANATLAIAHHELFSFFAGEADRRAGTAGDDAIRLLIGMRASDRRLTREEVAVNCYSLLLGANATTPHTISGTVLALLARPEQLRMVREDRSRIPALVEEGLRWTSAASSFLRHAVKDVELSGGSVGAGEAVAVWIGAANRDEEVFSTPETFDVRRTPNRHLAFGYGPHYCLGAAVARLTLRLFFEEALDLMPSWEVAAAARPLASNFIAGYSSVPLRTRRHQDAVRGS